MEYQEWKSNHVVLLPDSLLNEGGKVLKSNKPQHMWLKNFVTGYMTQLIELYIRMRVQAYVHP